MLRGSQISLPSSSHISNFSRDRLVPGDEYSRFIVLLYHHFLPRDARKIVLVRTLLNSAVKSPGSKYHTIKQEPDLILDY